MSLPNLNRRIQIQAQGESDLDSFQQPLPGDWGTIYECWAEIDVQQSQLIYSTAEFMSKVTHRITIRYTSSVIFSAKQRILYTDPGKVTHTYEIIAPLNDKQANTWLIFMCYELSGQE